MTRRPLDALTRREREVLSLVQLGLTNEEIAQRLEISLDGAKYHVSQILSKLGVSTREEAAAWHPSERRSLYWKLGWVGGASIAVAAAAGLAALLSDSGRNITLESGVVAGDSITEVTHSTPIGRASQPVDQSAPNTTSPSSSSPADAGQSVRASSLAVVGPGGVPILAPRPTPTQTPAAPTPTDVDMSSQSPASVTPTPTPTVEPPTATPRAQSPRMSLDMDPSGNTYADGANTMTVGSIESCLTSATANPNTHLHTVHLVIENVNDLVGWQARMNHDGARMRPLSVNYAPFTDGNTGQGVSFLNLPLDGGSHRDIVSANSIPAPAAGPQTALIGAVYAGAQNAAVSPDTPPKAPLDDASYAAPSGGVLAAITLRVEAGQTGQASLIIDVDDGDPNAPGSAVNVFTGSGLTRIDLGEGALGDGFHGEGATCPAVRAAAPGRYAGFFRPVT